MKHKTQLLIVAGIVGAVAVSGLIWRIYNPSKANPNTAAKPATYDHGMPVPADSVDRAKQAGYYCPSWDAQAGVASSLGCSILDK